MQGSTASRGAPTVALFAIVGGLLSAVGSFLAWASVSAAGQGVSAKGTDGTDGYITLVAGIILILYGVARLTGSAMGTKKAMAVIAIVAGGVAVYDAVTAKERVLDEASSQVASSAGVTKDQARTLLDQAVSSGQVAISLSFGIFVVMAGGVLGLIGGVMGLRSPAEPAPGMPEMSAMGASAPAPMSSSAPMSPPTTPAPMSQPAPPAPPVPDVPSEPDTGSSP